MKKMYKLGTRREKEKRKAKYYLETYSGERKARSRLELIGGSADRSNQLGRVKKLCEGPMCHEA